MSKKFFSALITPLLDGTNHERRLDEKSLLNLFQLHIENKVGVVLFGSTGEGLNLPLSLKERIMELAQEHLFNKGIPVIMGAPGHDYQETQKWITRFNRFDIQGIMLTTPYYARPGVHGQRHWFQSLMEMSVHPSILYHVPSRTGIDLKWETLVALSDHPKLLGVKDAGGSIEHSEKLIELLKPKGKWVLSGDDPLLEKHFHIGLDGVISVLSQGALKLASKMSQEITEETLKEWGQLCEKLYVAPNPLGIKAYLYHLGLISSHEVMPPLSRQDLPENFFQLWKK